MKEIKKGGKRENAGRKPTDDPKIPITVYVETSRVQRNGGKVELAKRIIDSINSDFVGNPILERVQENNKPENLNKILKKRNQVSIKNLTKPLDNESANTLTDMEAEFQRLLNEKNGNKKTS